MRVDCAGCGKKHNGEAKAASCRARKAQQLARRPAAKFTGMSVHFQPQRSVLSMREYAARQTRDNALGMTCNEL